MNATRIFAVLLLLAAALPAQVYEYDAAGRLIRAVYPGGGGASYVYDDADNLTAVVPLQVPAAPMELTANRVSSTEARLTWQPSAGATGYRVERREVGMTEWEEVASLGGGATGYNDTDLTLDVDYEYRVQALGADGGGAFSDIVSTESGDFGDLLTLAPRIAAGESFVTSFQLVNLTDSEVPYRIGLYGSNGSPLSLPFDTGQGALAGNFGFVEGTLPASGGVVAETFPTGALQAGYAVLEQGADAASLTTALTQIVPGRDPFQSATALAGEPPLSRFPYINTRPFTTVMAVTNRKQDAQTVTLAANDPEGVTRCTSNLDLAAGEHAAFAIQERLACTGNAIGAVEVRSDGDGVGPISFVFHDFGPFTTNLPSAPGDLKTEGDIVPRIATGDSFETYFQITNVGETATPYRIDFFGADGSPLSLPMADAQGQPAGAVTSIAGTVPAGGVRVARTLANGPTLGGYGVLSTGAGEAAVTTTVTQLVPDRDPFQAAAPLVEPLTAARLPFDNTRPFTTVMALTNPVGGVARVTLIARGLDGRERCRDIRDLPGMGHDAFVIQDRLACTANAVGVLEIQADNEGVAPLSFIFHDFGPFTTNLPSALR